MNYTLNLFSQQIKTSITQTYLDKNTSSNCFENNPNSRTKILVTRIKRYANPRGEDLAERCNSETPRRSYKEKKTEAAVDGIE